MFFVFWLTSCNRGTTINAASILPYPNKDPQSDQKKKKKRNMKKKKKKEKKKKKKKKEKKKKKKKPGMHDKGRFSLLHGIARPVTLVGEFWLGQF